MIYREIVDDFILDDVVLSDFEESSEQLQHLVNVDCALALSICKSRNFSSCVFVLSLLYMKRLRSLQSSASLLKIDSLTTKELYLIATLLANKYLIDEGEDEQLFNSELAQLTDITIERINLIERQILSALHWNLHISNDEFRQFFALFKNQIAKRISKNLDKLETDDSIGFNLLPHIIEYLALTSLVVLGSSLSILTAIHIGTVTHSTLMRTLNPTMNCPQSSICHWNNRENMNSSQTKQINPFELGKHLWMTNDSTNNNHDYDVLSITRSSCSIDISRSIIESFG